MTRGSVRVELSPKRVRVRFGDVWLADSTLVKLVWEAPYYPTYYFPASDVRTDRLKDTGEVRRSPSRGDAAVHDVHLDGRVAAGAASWYRDSAFDELRDHIRLDWPSMDAWFEEDEEVFVHARDPYKRIDILSSHREVRVEVDGVEVARSTNARFLFETGLPTRYYLPKTDVRMDLLTPTDTHTDCPYKGTASYYAVTVDGAIHDDLVWWYPTAVHECAAIAGLVCFYNEKADIFVDGRKLERPRTKFS